MDQHEQDPSPDYLELTIEGMAFSVTYDSSQPGAYHYTRLPGPPGGPAVGYGFTSRSSDDGRRSSHAHEAAIRAFIAIVDPGTGYIEDADDEMDDV
ncbi:MAG: hypothetical protein KDB43_14855 [Nocardioidaceae bacterium]|nr:hypothetical protein [Nocardioidaceae bacterium]